MIVDLQRRVIRQFGNPCGVLGAAAGWIMATRPSNRERNRWAVSLLQVSAGHNVLEIGCGPGLALEMLCRATEARHIVGIDHSAMMVAMAARRLARCRAGGRAAVRRGDAGTLTFLPTWFDRILAVNSFAFWRDTPGAVNRIWTLCAPGGRFVVVHQPRGRHADDAAARRFAAAAVEQLTGAGFVDPRIEYLPLTPIVAGIVVRRPEVQ